MDEEVKYHEQNEGWTHEWLDDRKTIVAFHRPEEIGGGFVTVDFKQRIFSTGHGKPHKTAASTVYGGRDWRNRIVRGALDHLEKVMSEQKFQQSKPKQVAP